jgi:hypothetical protein
MITYGTWEGTFTNTPHRPIVNAIFMHACTQRCISLRFLVDTGADQTFIVPEHQKLLHIPDDFVGFKTLPVDTLAGKYPFNFLTNCSLIFTSPNKQPTTISNLTIYFSIKPNAGLINKILKRKKPEKPLATGDVYPSILGRDVLQQLSMGYCNTSDYLFLSQRHKDYYNCLFKEFPEPPKEEHPKTAMKWLEEGFDIGDIEVTPH